MREKSLQEYYDEIDVDQLHEAASLIYRAEHAVWSEYNTGQSWENWWNNSDEFQAWKQVKAVIALHLKLGQVLF